MKNPHERKEQEDSIDKGTSNKSGACCYGLSFITEVPSVSNNPR